MIYYLLIMLYVKVYKKFRISGRK